jgi:hypothetical protein
MVGFFAWNQSRYCTALARGMTAGALTAIMPIFQLEVNTMRTLFLAAALAAATAQAQTFPEILTAAGTELQRAYPPEASPVPMLEHLESFDFSAPTQAGLVKLFGTGHPFRVQAKAGANGERIFHWTVLPADYRFEGGHTTSTPFESDIRVKAGGARYTMAGRLAEVRMENAGNRVEAHGFRMQMDQRRGIEQLWFGTARYLLESVRMTPAKGPEIEVSGMRGESVARQRGTLVDMAMTFDAGRVRIGGEELLLRSKLSIVGLPARAMADMGRAAYAANHDATTRQAQAQVLGASFLRLLADGTATLKVDGLEFGFRGHVARVRGELRVAALPDAEHANATQVMERLNGKFEVRVPLALVRAIAAAVQQHGQQVPSAQASAEVAQTMADTIVGKIVGGGYGRLEKDTIVIEVTIKEGKVYAGGKLLELPKPTRVPAGAGVNGTAFLPPRRVVDQCPLPALPPLEGQRDPLRVRVTIGTDGHTRQADLPGAGNDALRAALMQCRWIPAVVNGKERDIDALFVVQADDGGATQLRYLSPAPSRPAPAAAPAPH